jgi:hypothetical protein
MSWLLAVIFRPVASLVLYGLILLPGKLLAQHMPDGKLKRLLLRDLHPGGDADWTKQGSR